MQNELQGLLRPTALLASPRGPGKARHRSLCHLGRGPGACGGTALAKPWAQLTGLIPVKQEGRPGFSPEVIWVTPKGRLRARFPPNAAAEAGGRGTAPSPAARPAAHYNSQNAERAPDWAPLWRGRRKARRDW